MSGEFGLFGGGSDTEGWTRDRRLGIVRWDLEQECCPVSRYHLRRQRQLRAIGEEVRRLPGVTISGVLTVEEVAAAAEACDLRFRQRLFSPFVTLWLFVWQALSPDGSCREAVLRRCADRPINDRGKAIVATTGSYCRARQRLPLGLIVTLIGRVAERLFERLSEEH